MNLKIDNYFDIFDKYRSNNNNTDINETNPEICLHKDRIIHLFIETCKTCGVLISNTSLVKNYNINSNCCSRKRLIEKNTSNILKDIESLNLTTKIADTANFIFSDFSNGVVFRGTSRRAIIFACVYNAYTIHSIPQKYENLLHVFNINKKQALKALKLVSRNLPKDSIYSSIRVSTKDIIKNDLYKINCFENELNYILDIYISIEGKSYILNRARISSISAGIIFYYILKTKKHKI